MRRFFHLRRRNLSNETLPNEITLVCAAIAAHDIKRGLGWRKVALRISD
jgi:hypothetical protein